MIRSLESPEAEFAIQTVGEAALLVRRVQRQMVGQAQVKDDRSPVTVADFAAQALVAYRLAERFPDAALIGEEQAGALKTDEGRTTLDQIVEFLEPIIAGIDAARACDLIDRGGGEPPARFWTLDPIDGTKGFLRNDQYAVALGLVEDGAVSVGALACPELEDAIRPAPGGRGSLVVAGRGAGAFARPLAPGADSWKPLAVSEVDSAAAARLLRSVEKGHTDADAIGELATWLGIVTDPIGMDSQAKYAVLAAGGAELMLRLLSPRQPEYREKIWDQAAGSLVVQEAGGRVTDLDGQPLDFTHGRTLAANRGVVATNARLHDAVLAGVRAIGA